MAEEWICEICAVRNDATDIACACCTTARPDSSYLGAVNASTVASTKRGLDEMQNSVSSVEKKQKTDDKERIRFKFSFSDLGKTCVFICGSSEVEQIPSRICDVRRVGNDIESMYECRYPTPIIAPFKSKVAQVACGALHTAILTANGQVYTFGCNDMGALGRDVKIAKQMNIADSEPMLVRIKPSIKKVTCGDNHTLMLTRSGSVLFCGAFRDTTGNIGICDYNDYDELKSLDFQPTPVTVPCDERDSNYIIDIASGENHCLLLPRGGKGIHSFGSNEFGQLMLNTQEIQIVQDLDDIDLTDEQTKKLALTWPQYQSCKELGLPGTSRRRCDEYIVGIYAGYCTSFIKTQSKKVYGCGRNAQGEVGCASEELQINVATEIKKLNGLDVEEINGGQFFTNAIANGNLYTWGNSDFTGHGHMVKETKQTAPMVLNVFNTEDVYLRGCFVGADCSFVLTSNGDLYGWGSAQNYILGNGFDYIFQKEPQPIPQHNFANFQIIGGMGGAQHTVFIGSR